MSYRHGYDVKGMNVYIDVLEVNGLLLGTCIINIQLQFFFLLSACGRRINAHLLLIQFK